MTIVYEKCLKINIIFRYNRSTVSAAVTSVLTGELDAFIYDGTVLDYLVSQVSHSEKLIDSFTSVLYSSIRMDWRESPLFCFCYRMKIADS